MTKSQLFEPKFINVDVKFDVVEVVNKPRPERTLANCWRLLRGRPLVMQSPPVYQFLHEKLAMAYMTVGAANDMRTFFGEPLLVVPPDHWRGFKRFVRWQLFGWFRGGPRKL